MPFASATKAQRQAVRDTIINAAKSVELAVDTGPVATLGPTVDTQTAALAAAMAAAGTGSGGTATTIATGKQVTVPVTFTTARTAGATANVAVTITVANGAISAITVA